MDRPALRTNAIVLLGLLPIFAAIVAYSLTWAFISDEGFHLIAAHLIASGKRPYIDFCFPQTPLNAYINATVLLAFGNTWRPIHLVASLYVCVTAWLVADFVRTRIPDERWRMSCAFAGAALFGLNIVVIQFGPSAQAYAIGMLLGTAAFRASISAASSKRVWFALLAGLCAGGAAASTLLTATVPLVLLGWIVFSNAAGSRWQKTAVYLLGCALPFAPVFWLYSQGQKQTLFNVLQYQAMYRRTNWGNANLHDIDALTDWVNSPTGLMLMVFFAAAIIFLFRDQNANLSAARREFLLAAALGVASVVFISTAHPTFERYYCVGVPFLAIVAALGLYATASRLASPSRAWLSCSIVIALTTCIFLRSLFDERTNSHWSDYESVAQHVAEVTPLGANMIADETVYFLLQRDPPEGLEFSYAEKLELPPDQEKLYHIVSVKELKQEMRAGRFATMQTCRESILNDLEPEPYFRQHTEPNDCDIFWQPKATTSTAQR